MERFMICGDEKDIISALSKYMDPSGARMVMRSLPGFSDLVDDDETLEINRRPHGPQNAIGYMIPKTDYHIDLKLTTIAFIGLLLDVAFTKGFAAFVLNVFGVTADTIKKLSNLEKCVLFLIKADVVQVEEDGYVLMDHAHCMDFARDCDCRRYDRCGLSKEMLSKTVQKLLEKEIIKQTGDSLVYRF